MSTPTDAARVLLVASNVPPVRGGSAVVYDSLARHAGGAIRVLAPRRSYVDGLAMIGWREHDRRARYPVLRLDLLRTVLHDAAGPDQAARRGGAGAAWRRATFLAGDLRIRWRLARTVLGLVLHGPVRAVCVGELLSSGWLLGLLRGLIRLGLRLRLVVYVHGEEITTLDPYDPGRQRCRAALDAADRIVVVSRFTLDAVHALLGPGAEARTCLIENGVDTRRFRPGTKREDLVEQYGLAGCLVFVSVCRLLEKKGLDQTIRALARLAPSLPEARYLSWAPVRSSPGSPHRRRARRGRRRCVRRPGRRGPSLAAHYRLGDVFVMPNRALPNGDTEGFRPRVPGSQRLRAAGDRGPRRRQHRRGA